MSSEIVLKISNREHLLSLIKKQDIWPDANDNPDLSKATCAIYSSHYSDVIIFHYWESDDFKMKSRETNEFLSEAAIASWIKKVENGPRAECTKSNHEITSINFNSNQNFNGRKLVDVERLFDIPPSTRVNEVNKWIQENVHLLDGKTDEEIIDTIVKVEAQYFGLQRLLRSHKIKVLERDKQTRQEEYARERVNKSNGLNAQGQKTAKLKKKIKSSKASSDGFNITLDPLYPKYCDNKPMVAFFKAIKKNFSDTEAMNKWNQLMALDAIEANSNQ